MRVFPTSTAHHPAPPDQPPYYGILMGVGRGCGLVSDISSISVKYRFAMVLIGIAGLIVTIAKLWIGE